VVAVFSASTLVTTTDPLALAPNRAPWPPITATVFRRAGPSSTAKAIAVAQAACGTVTVSGRATSCTAPLSNDSGSCVLTSPVPTYAVRNYARCHLRRVERGASTKHQCRRRAKPRVPAPLLKTAGAAHLLAGLCAWRCTGNAMPLLTGRFAMYPMPTNATNTPVLYSPATGHTGGAIFSGRPSLGAPLTARFQLPISHNRHLSRTHYEILISVLSLFLPRNLRTETNYAGTGGSAAAMRARNAGTGNNDPTRRWTHDRHARRWRAHEAIPQSACSPGTAGCGWQDNDLVTWSQVTWATRHAGNAAQLLRQQFQDDIPEQPLIAWPAVLLDHMADPDALLNYLPASGTPRALTLHLLDPRHRAVGYSARGRALRLNTEFGDAGLLNGNSGLLLGILR